MNNIFSKIAALILVLVCIVGCGDGKLRTKGRLVKGGSNYAPPAGQLVQITFVPIPPDGSPARDYYFADVDQKNGSFMPAGKDGRGLPTGKYRVAVELMEKRSDTLRGKFDAENSPFEFVIDQNLSEIVIDLDTATKEKPIEAEVVIRPPANNAND